MASLTSALLEELAAACPSLGARTARPEDAVDGVEPRYVARPASATELSLVMDLAARHRLAVVARSAATKLDWGLPPNRLDLVVELAGMSRVLEHAKGDLVLRVEAGALLASMQAQLALERQWLPIDEVVSGSSLGGIVATGLSGPSRLAYGGVRDLLIGATVVRADGTLARVGGKVVKNVAGYDLCKLFTGSYGTLAILAELTFRLRPLPSERRFLSAELGEADLALVLDELRHSQMAPSAIELARDKPEDPFVLTVLVEGRPGPVEARTKALAQVLGRPALSDAPPAAWGELPGQVTLKATYGLSALPHLLTALRLRSKEAGLAPTVRASPGIGILYAGLPADVPLPSLAALLSALREDATGTESVVVLRGPRSVRTALEVWGPVAGIGLMRRIKSEFDPEARLAPGRFVGGI
jgi:glycolate oxidase FAD binding subunit